MLTKLDEIRARYPSATIARLVLVDVADDPVDQIDDDLSAIDQGTSLAEDDRIAAAAAKGAVWVRVALVDGEKRVLISDIDSRDERRCDWVRAAWVVLNKALAGDFPRDIEKEQP